MSTFGSTRVPPPDGRGPDHDATIASAIQDVSDKAQLLVREEIALAKAELEAKVTALAKGAAIGAAAGVFVLAALLLILHGFAWLAYYVLPVNNSSVFWGYFLMAGIFLVLAAVAGLLAKKFLTKGSPPTPQMAIDEGKAIQRTVQDARAAEVQR